MRGIHSSKTIWRAALLTVLLLLNVSLFFGQGNPKISKEAVKKKYKSSHSHFVKGEKQFRKGKYESSEAELKKCLDILSLHDRAHFYLAYIYYKRGDLTRSLNHIEKAKESYKILADIQFEEWMEIQTSVLEQIQRKQNLEGNLEAVTDSCSYDEWAQIFNLSINDSEKQIRDLETEQRNAMLGNPFPPADYYFLHGNVLFKLKDYLKACDNYSKALEIDPKHADAYNNLTAAYFSAKNYQKAMDSLESAEIRGVKTNADLKKAVMEAIGSSAASMLEREFSGGVKKFIVNVGDKESLFYENTYVVFDIESKDAVIIDPGIPDKRIESFISARKLKVRKILNTHGHSDHTGANDFYANLFDVDVIAHEADRPLYERAEDTPDIFFTEEGLLNIEGIQTSVIHTPGHTPGSVCFLINGMLISGDTLFENSIGKTQGETPLDEIRKMNEEVEYISTKLLSLPEETAILPGHGLTTSIGDERRNNPFLNKASVFEIIKRQFGTHPDIVKIERLKNDPDDFGVLVHFRSESSLEKFKVSYGQLFLGLRLRLEVGSE